MIQYCQGYFWVFPVKGYSYILPCKLHLPPNTLSSHMCPFRARTSGFCSCWLTSLLFHLCLASPTMWLSILQHSYFGLLYLAYTQLHMFFFFSFKLISANTIAELGSRVTQMPHGWGGQLSSTTIQQFGSSLAVVLTAFLEPSYEPDPLNRNVTHVSKGFEGFGIYERPICRDGNCVIWFCCFGRILL